MEDGKTAIGSSGSTAKRTTVERPSHGDPTIKHTYSLPDYGRKLFNHLLPDRQHRELTRLVRKRLNGRKLAGREFRTATSTLILDSSFFFT